MNNNRVNDDGRGEGSVVAATKSWKCCKCKHENYYNEWKCSDPACGHDRCRNCTDLLG